MNPEDVTAVIELNNILEAPWNGPTPGGKATLIADLITWRNSSLGTVGVPPTPAAPVTPPVKPAPAPQPAAVEDAPPEPVAPPVRKAAAKKAPAKAAAKSTAEPAGDDDDF